MLIGEVADLTGINVQSLRYYERMGLLDEPRRRSSGYRDYPVEAVAEVQFIKCAREIGFSLEEIKELMELRRMGGNVCETTVRLAESKIRTIRRRIEDLTAMQSALENLLASCTSSSDSQECEVIEALFPASDDWNREEDLVS